MEAALCKIEAKANGLQNTLEQQNESTSSGETANEKVFNKVDDVMNEQFTCSICSELFITAMNLNCAHTFCQYCINTWIKTKKECPVCRTGITAMNRSLVLDNFIDKMVENLSTEYKKRRTEIVDERREDQRLANEPSNQGGGGMRGGGQREGANANQNQNPPGNASAAATRSVGSTSNYQQTSANYQGAGTAYQQTNHYYDYSTWSSSSDNEDSASNISNNADSQSSEDPEGHVMDVDDIWDEDQDKEYWDVASNISSNADSQPSEDPEGHVTDVDNMTDGDQDREDGDNASNISSNADSPPSEDPEGHVSDVDNITDGDQDPDDHSAGDSEGGMDDEYDGPYWSDPDLSDD